MTYAYVMLRTHTRSCYTRRRCAATMEQVSNCKRVCVDGYAYVFGVYIIARVRASAFTRVSLSRIRETRRNW